jgi:hypothetical protein
MRVGRDSAEQIRRREVSRVLRKVDLSPEEEAVERMSRSLVGRLLHGPISRVMAHAEVEISSTDRRNLEVSCELERYGGEVGSPGSKTHQIRAEGKRYIRREADIESDRVHDPAEDRICPSSSASRREMPRCRVRVSGSSFPPHGLIRPRVQSGSEVASRRSECRTGRPNLVAQKYRSKHTPEATSPLGTSSLAAVIHALEFRDLSWLASDSFRIHRTIV